MAYFTTREVAAIAICAALWGVLNSLLAPAFFTVFHLPFFCDVVGFSVLIFAAWWIRKFGAITLIGAVATLINFSLAPNPYHFLGFTAACVFFDSAVALFGFERLLKTKTVATTGMTALSVASAALAGLIIGALFLAEPVLASAGGAFGWAGLHAVGGVIGGAIGVALVVALDSRKISRVN